MADWDRLPDEPSLWFDRFERFRLMGPSRTMLGCLNAEEAGKSGKKRSARTPGAWDDAAERWRWRERATAWDDEQVRLAREAEAAALAERRQVWIEQAKAIQTKAWKRLKDMQPGELSVKDTLEYFREGVKLEMLATGQPTEITRADVNDVTRQIADLERSFSGAADRSGAGAVRGDGTPQPVAPAGGEGGPDDEAG